MMNIRLGPAGDLPMRPDAPGTYEWWYFDAIDETQEIAITIILFDGMPMSPYWLNALPDARAEDYRGYAISIYRKGKKIAGYIHHTNHNSIMQMEHSLHVQMGDICMVKDDSGKYTISFETAFEESPHSIHGVLAFTPLKSNAHDSSIGEGNHCWRLIAPLCTVSGEISLMQYQQEYASINFSGHGYHDCNAGNDALDADYDEWYWGRIPLDEAKTLIYYHYPKCSRHREYSIAFVSDANGIHPIDECTITLNNISLTSSLMSIARSIQIMGTIAGNTFQALIRHQETLEFGPFYYRFLTSILHTDGDARTYHGISEYFNARRLRSGLVRTMIKTPIKRI
ncbi:MAG: hypothetical protein ACKOFB_00520 [bacterium]